MVPRSGKQVHVCSCCAKAIRDGLSDEPSLHFGPKAKRVLDAVRRAKDAGISRPDVAAIVYSDDPDGGPDSSNVISVVIHKMNKKLAPHGMKIQSTGGPGAVYRLIKIELPKSRWHSMWKKPFSNPELV